MKLCQDHPYATPMQDRHENCLCKYGKLNNKHGKFRSCFKVTICEHGTLVVLDYN